MLRLAGKRFRWRNWSSQDAASIRRRISCHRFSRSARVSPIILGCVFLHNEPPLRKSNLPINEREREMIIRHARFITVLLLISFTTGAQLRAEAEEESLRYACDFERDCGIFLAEAKGNGFTARSDTSSAHSGRQSVQLVDAGGADVDLVWMREWDNWTTKPSKASLQWARHLTPDRPIRLQKRARLRSPCLREDPGCSRSGAGDQCLGEKRFPGPRGHQSLQPHRARHARLGLDFRTRRLHGGRWRTALR